MASSSPRLPPPSSLPSEPASKSLDEVFSRNPILATAEGVEGPDRQVEVGLLSNCRAPAGGRDEVPSKSEGECHRGGYHEAIATRFDELINGPFEPASEPSWP